VTKARPKAAPSKSAKPKVAKSKPATASLPAGSKAAGPKSARPKSARAKAAGPKSAGLKAIVRKAAAAATARVTDERPFWQRKRLEEMTAKEWESLCDGCGRCCLNKLEEEETGKLFFTDVACKLLDHGSCRCSSYKTRFRKVPDCVQLTPDEVRKIDWLPPTCAYDLVAKGKDLYWWHPLVSGDPDTVHAAGVSVRGKVGASEADVPDEELENWIVKWPGQVPKAARAAAAAVAKERTSVPARRTGTASAHVVAKTKRASK